MIKLSASSIGTFEKCPRKYYYHYIEKPEIPEKEWEHLEFGTCVHRVLELFHEDLLSNVRRPDEYPKVMKECFKRGLSEFDVDLLRNQLQLMKECLQFYLQKILKDGLPEVLYNELEFKFNIGDFLVRGYIDRIDLVSPGHYKVVDYKTNKNPKYLNDFQLRLYALAIRKKFDDIKQISGSFVLLKHQSKTLDYEFDKYNLEETIQHVLNVGKDIDIRSEKESSEEWEKKPTKLCDWCDYQNICLGNWVE